jgi:hypothetical protein
MKRFIFPVLLLCCVTGLYAQYLEDFTGQNGRGLVNAICPAGTTNINNCGSACAANATDNTTTCTTIPPSFAGVNWTIGLGPATTYFTDLSGFGFEFSSPDDFGVVSDRMQVDDPDQEICWFSPTLNISAAGTVSISVDVSQSGGLESTDYIRGEYSLDGGSFIPFETQSGAFAATQLNVSGLSGTTLRIRICAFTNGGGEQIFFDNVSVPQTGVTVYCPPPACSVTGAGLVCDNSTGNIYTAPAGMASYNWSISGSGSIPGSTTGQTVSVTSGTYLQNYTVAVTITDANGCVSNCTKHTDIFLETPPANITVNPNPVCFGASIDLSFAAAASSTVSWTGEGISNSGGTFVPDGFGGYFNQTTATPTSPGPKVYAVDVTVPYGIYGTCSNTGSVNVTVDPCNIDFSGKIIFSNNNSLGVNNATVNLVGSGTGSDVSDTNGDFSISPGVNSGTFTLTPTKTTGKLNGVTAADVTAIQQHVGNSTPITDPYKLVAADVNKTNSVNSLDVSIVNQALLGNPSALAQIKTSWRFVPTSHTMTNPPWGFPEKRTYTNINSSQSNQDFYGIKTGDIVTTFANPANFGAGQPLVLQGTDRVLQAGEDIVVTFSANQADDLAAFQCALRFDPEQLQVVEIQPSTAIPLAMDNFGTYNIAEGEIRMVWAQASGVAFADGSPVFSLQFATLQSGAKLSEVLRIDESELQALSYTTALAESKVELTFSELSGTANPAGAAGVQLLQNRPNPFNGQTSIGFVLPEACEAQLRIFDVSGRLLAERKGQYPAGKNEELFEASGATGVLYYELTTPFGVATRKMVLKN